MNEYEALGHYVKLGQQLKAALDARNSTLHRASTMLSMAAQRTARGTLYPKALNVTSVQTLLGAAIQQDQEISQLIEKANELAPLADQPLLSRE